MREIDFGTIMTLVKGKKPRQLFKEAQEGALPYVDIKAFELNEVQNYTDGVKCVPCDENDVLIVCDGSRSGLVGKGIKGYVGSTLAKVSAEGIIRDYLYYFLQSKYRVFNTHKKGTGTPHLNQELLKSQKIIILPIQQQQKIVSRIEELFSKLDKGVETLQTIKQQLAVYRQAVLTEAFEGIENTVELGSIASIVDPHPSHRTPVEVIGGVPYIGVGDIDYVHHVIDFSSARKVSNDILQDHLSRYTLHDGDFIMGKIGTIGKPFIIALPQNYTLSANVILIQPNKKVVIPKYLFWQVSSSQITKQLLEGSTSTTQPAFGIKKARLLSIKICSLEEQNRIVQKIESHLSLCDDIGQSVTAALSQAEAMRQSILKQAFEGTL